MQTTLTLIAVAVMPLLVVAAALRDVTTMTIPNWISAALIVLFFPAAWVAGLSLGAVGGHVLVGLGALAVVAGMFALGWMGGGDAKLIAAASLWLGLSGAWAFLLWTAVAGGVFSLILILARQAAPSPAGPAWLGRLLTPKGDVPYGVAIAAGALMAYPSSALFAAAVSGAA